jgi:hypothetical protein
MSPTYVDCLDPASNEKMLLRWLYTMELASLQAKKTLGVLDAVKRAVLDCLGPDYEVFYDIINADLLIQDTSGHTLPFRLLSDGVRNMLGMVADIAYRAAVLSRFMWMPCEGYPFARDKVVTTSVVFWPDSLRRYYNTLFLSKWVRAGALIFSNEVSISPTKGICQKDVR